jgi:hypothetical protein
MGIVLNILGGIIAGFFAAGIYEWIRRPRLDIALLPQMSLTSRNGSWVATQHVRVANCELPRFLRRFLRRNDAHSCYVWVMLYEPEPLGPGVSGARYDRANWVRVYRHPTTRSLERGMLIPSSEMVGQFIDLADGEVADIAVVEKTTGESVCIILPWGERLEIGKYVLKVEVGSSGLSPVPKWFLLENKGIATDPNSLVDSFAVNELRKKEVRKYLSSGKLS